MVEDTGLADAGGIFCAHCGYSLRGLAGDPIRCPECGKLTPVELGEAVGPEIERQLQQLESAPAMSAAGIVLLAMFSLTQVWALQHGHRGLPQWMLGGLQVASVALLVAGYRIFASRCRTSAGWRAYWRYVLIASVACGVTAGLVWAAPLVLKRESQAWMGIAVGVCGMSMAAGPRLQRWAREPLDGAQRALAVMLAERRIRKDEASRAREP